MNREIKFRVWLKEEKKMVEVKEIIFYPEKQIAYDAEYRNGKSLSFHYLNYKLFEDIELMQYTGLKDKNGVEIYEGDIVKIWGRGFTNKLGSVNSIVVFEEAQFTFYINKQYYKIWGDSCEMYEVIGNIYENKELLEEK